MFFARSLPARSAVRFRKFTSMRWPYSVRTDSGWNCTPHSGRLRCRSPIRTPSSAQAVASSDWGSGSRTASEW